MGMVVDWWQPIGMVNVMVQEALQAIIKLG
jgi:hypothetical protein